MKRALDKDIIREIKNTFSRFMSILLMVALGVFVFVALTVTEPIMNKSAEAKIEQSNMYDIVIRTIMGLEEKDIDIINSQPGISDIEYSFEDYFQVKGTGHYLRLTSMPKRISTPVVKEGRLPKSKGELALDYDLKEKGNYQVGKELSLNPEQDKYNLNDEDRVLHTYDYTIVGFVETAEVFDSTYKGSSLRDGGTLDGFGYILPSDFNLDNYTTARIKYENLEDYNTYDDEYAKLLSEHDERLTLSFGMRPKERLNNIRTEIQDGIDTGRAEIEDAKDEIAEGEEKLNQAQEDLEEGEAEYHQGRRDFNREISDAEKELNDGGAELSDAKRVLDSSKAQLDEAQRHLDAGERAIEDNEDLLEQGKEQYYDGLDEYRRGAQTLEESKRILDQGEAELNQGRAELEEARRQLAEGEAQYNEGLRELEAKRPELEAGMREYEKGLREYNEKMAQVIAGGEEYERGLAQYFHGLRQIQDARTALEVRKAQIAAKEIGLLPQESGLDELKIKMDLALAMAGLNRPSQVQSKIEELEAQKIRLLSNISSIEENITQMENNYKGPYGIYPPEILSRLTSLRASLTQEQLRMAEVDTTLAAIRDLPQLVQQVSGAQQDYDLAKVEIEAERAEIENAESQLNKQERELNDNKLKLDAGKVELDKNLALLIESKIKLDIAKVALDYGEWQLFEGEKQLSDAQRELAAGRSQFEVGEAEFNRGLAELENGRVQYNQGAAELQRAEGELERAKAEIDSGALQLSKGRRDLSDAVREYYTGRIQYERGEVDYNAGVRNFIEGTKRLQEERTKGQNQLDEAWTDIEDGKATLESNLQEFEDQKSEAMDKIAKGESEIEDAVTILELIKQPNYSIVPRNVETAVYQYFEAANSMKRLSYVFPVFFYMISMLVSLTTMTRMVDEQRVSMGTLKALGYGNNDISKKFFIYGTSASVIGGIIGGVLGNFFLSRVIGEAYSVGSIVDELIVGFYPIQNLLAIGIGILCTGFVALLVLRRVLKENSAQLMRPKAPKGGNRILLERVEPLWSRLNFFQKVTARNLFRYKKRMAMTLFGVIGCTALLVLGFGINTSVRGVVDKQFDELTNYDMLILHERLLSTSSFNSYKEKLENDQGIARHTEGIFEIYTTDQVNGIDQSVSLIVPRYNVFNDVLVLRDRKSGDTIELPQDGVVLTEKLAYLKRLNVDDVFYIENDVGEIYQVKLKAIAEGYAGHYMYMSEEYYSGIFGEEYVPNADFIVLNENGQNRKTEILDSFTEEKAVLSAVSFDYLRNIMVKLMDSIDIVVLVIVIASAMLAMVVLYNLTNINISERMRELSTIKVLGFYTKEVTDYIYRETWILTILGIVIGFVVGKFMHNSVLKVVVPDNAMLDPKLRLSNFVIAAAITIVVSIFVRFTVSRKLKNIDMIEALKGVE